MRHRLATTARSFAALGALAALAACADRSATAPGAGGPSFHSGAQPDVTCTISPGSATLAQGATVSLSASCTDWKGKAVSRTFTWGSSAAAIAAVSTGGTVAGLAAGTATITATTSDGRASAVITVGGTTAPTPAPPSTPYTGPGQGGAPVVAGHTNQPAGMRLVTNRAFSSKAKTSRDRAGAEGWDPIEGRYANFSLVSDPTAPASKSTVGQYLYPAGFKGGTSPANAQIAFAIPAKTLYLSLWVKLSSNFQGHRSSTNKMFFLWIAGGQRFFLSAEGAGSNALIPEVRLQGKIPDKRPRLMPNMARNVSIQRGKWQHWELVVTANTPGRSDGVVQWWIDGTLITDYRDMAILNSRESQQWTQFQWSSTWGGGNDVVNQNMYLQYDHVYISAK
jgi:hypothetical protein